ncbi:MAG: amidohydrolase family protein [Gemmatimonadota bacterium]|nr:amidohydrolase family protein [Gemmatimonadota bacterium]MDE2954560.1 amidohydrolase family protein [Gemmatimonadota bacterium]
MPIIDSHLHVFEKLSEDFPREVNAQCPADRAETAEKLLEVMAANGVDQAVLTQIGGEQLPHHQYLQHCLKTYPNRFRGIGLIPRDEWDAPEDHMDRLAENGDIIGFRINEIGGPADPLSHMDVRTFTSYRIWKHAAKKDYVMWLYIRAKDAHQVAFMVRAFPEIRAVFNHLMICPGEGMFSWDDEGRPHINTPIPPLTRYSMLGLHEYPNICVHLSGQYAFSQEAWPYRDLESWHKTLLSKFGADKLMWATDFPWILEDPGYDKLVQVIDELLPDLNAQQKAKIMGGTAKRVLDFPDVAD